jgi:Transposase domain (DUF772)
MMGPRQVEHGALFYNFSLDAHVPADHLLRSIDRFVDLSELRRELAPFYSTLGRLSIDPELLIRMLIVGYCFGIRSERRLCEEVHLNLAYRWFCRLGLDGDVPESGLASYVVVAKPLFTPINVPFEPGRVIRGGAPIGNKSPTEEVFFVTHCFN